MNLKMIIKLQGIILLFALLSACGDNKGPTDTPTQGNIRISVDETFGPVIESEVSTFHSIYTYANINARYTSEYEAFRDLMNDSARLIIVTRRLTADEKQYFEQRKLFPVEIKVANDAVAFIVNRENMDTAFTQAQLKSIISGSITKWSDINPASKLGDIRIVFDNKTSGLARYLKERLNDNKDLPANTYAVENNKEVVEYVNKDKNAIGVVGVNWISDDDDPMTVGFVEKVTVVAVGDSLGKEFNKPYQGYIADKTYPLRREVFIISREPRTGLGSGFASFVASDKGQTIILKSGLVPATMPVRLLEIKN